MAWVQEVTTQPWGHRAFYVRDPDGNVLNVHTVVEVRAATGTGAVASPIDGPTMSRQTRCRSSPGMGYCHLARCLTQGWDDPCTTQDLPRGHDRVAATRWCTGCDPRSRMCHGQTNAHPVDLSGAQAVLVSCTADDLRRAMCHSA
jgi:hypothetical protein